jgi:hypothetical protein
LQISIYNSFIGRIPAIETTLIGLIADPKFKLVFATTSGQFHLDKKVLAHLPGLAKTKQDLNP